MSGWRDDKGAVAILAAALTVVFLALSALTVDYANYYVRDAQAQQAVDAAALAGAGALVSADDLREFTPSAAFDAAFSVLEANPVRDGSSYDLPSRTEFDDDNPSNGEIDVDLSALEVTVTLPPRRVDFGLGAMYGIDGISTSAIAAAQVRTPAKTLPFFLPKADGCTTGPVFFGLAPPPEDPEEPEFTPVSAPAGPTLDSLTPPTVGAGDPEPVMVLIQGNFFAKPDGVDFTRGSTVAVESVDEDLITFNPDPLVLDSVSVQVPASVLGEPGEWWVRVHDSLGFGEAVSLQVEPAPIIDCGEAATGDLGLVGPESELPQRLGRGFESGLCADVTVCGDWEYFNEVRVDRELDPSDAGPGLLFDSGGTDALLGNPPGPCDSLAACLDNESYHSDHTIGALAGRDCTDMPHEGPSLKSDIYQSPKFFLIPVVDVSPADPSGEYDVVGYRGAFLTNETASGLTAGPSSGLTVLDGAISRVEMFAFCTDDLPEGARAVSGGYDWAPGLPAMVRLVDI